MTVKVVPFLPVLEMPAAMSSRDHPFNRSTRPLLMERKPQLLLKKKGDTKVHGFNDFDIMSQQYKNLNTHIGYPYGSPPSPSANSDDFVFSESVPGIYNTPKTFVGNTVDNFESDSWRKPSKLDDLAWRQHQKNLQGVFGEHNSTSSGPFIFGVHNADAYAERNTTVIHSTRTYSIENGQPVALNQSKSDTSASSQNTEKDDTILVKERKNIKERKNKRDRKETLDKNCGKENRPKIKCVLVGDGAVGKTSLIVTYLENRFLREHVPTASDIYNAEVMVNDSPVHVTLCDTAGQDTLDPLRELCYPDSDVFLLCFSVVKPETFRSIKTKWTPKFTKTRAALILVGTQADLRTDPHVLNKLQIEGYKPISFADAWDLATSIGAKYVETSSLTQAKVKEVFDTAIWDALLPNHLPPPPPSFWKRLFCFA